MTPFFPLLYQILHKNCKFFELLGRILRNLTIFVATLTENLQILPWNCIFAHWMTPNFESPHQKSPNFFWCPHRMTPFFRRHLTPNVPYFRSSVGTCTSLSYLSAPRAFKGSSSEDVDPGDVDDWLDSFSRYSEFTSWNPQKKYACLKSLFPENTARWLRRQDFAELNIFELLKAALETRYRPQQAQLFQLHQRLLNKSVLDFNQQNQLNELVDEFGTNNKLGHCDHGDVIIHKKKKKKKKALQTITNLFGTGVIGWDPNKNKS